MAPRNFYRVWDFWLRLPEKLRFLLIGGLNTLFAYLLFVLCLWICGSGHYQLSLALAWVLSSFVSFSLMKIFVFCSHGGWRNEYIKCAVSWMLSYIVNVIVLEAAVSWWGWSAYMGQVLAIAVYTCVTYLLFKHFAFRYR